VSWIHLDLRNEVAALTLRIVHISFRLIELLALVVHHDVVVLLILLHLMSFILHQLQVSIPLYIFGCLGVLVGVDHVCGGRVQGHYLCKRLGFARGLTLVISDVHFLVVRNDPCLVLGGVVAPSLFFVSCGCLLQIGDVALQVLLVRLVVLHVGVVLVQTNA